MLGVIGSFGPLPFVCSRDKVLTFTELTKETSIRWAKHDVIGKKPFLEWIGPDLATASLTIAFHTSLGFPPLVGLTMLRKMLSKRQYNRLIIGGENLGRFVIESIEEERKYHTGAGVCQMAIAKFSLTEYAK